MYIYMHECVSFAIVVCSASSLSDVAGIVFSFLYSTNFIRTTHISLNYDVSR